MSFSADVKNEICAQAPAKKSCWLAQCYGVLLFGNTFAQDCVRVVTENQELIEQLPRMFRKAFGITFDEQTEGMGYKQVFTIQDPQKLDLIWHSFGFDRRDTLALHVNLGVLEDDLDRIAFLRGAFLAGGSVTDPAKGYHLELTTSHSFAARETSPIIEELLGTYPKLTSRSGSSVLYFKSSDSISDFLTLLGASNSAMTIIETRLEKELNNKVNRRCNCDDANTSKVVEASQEQIAAIRILEEKGILDSLPPKLALAAKARLENPESNLTELAGLMESPITKSSMSHRLKRLVELSKEGN